MISAMAVVGALTLLVKIAATAKDVAVANSFGTTDLMDAFLIAFLLPSFVITVFAGAVPPALIPVYVRVLEREGPGSARQLLSSTLLFGAMILIGVSVLLAGASSQLLSVVGAGFDAPKLRTTELLLMVLLPGILLQGMSTIASAALNARDRYALPAVTPLLTPLVIVAVILYPQGWGIYALVVGTLIGMLLEIVLLGGALVRRRLIGFPVLRRSHHELRSVWNQYLPALLGSAVMGGAAVVDQFMAAALGPGSVSFLNYGSKLVIGLLGIGVFALATPLLPLFSRLVEAGSWKGIRSDLQSFGKFVMIVTIPGSLLLIYFSEDLVRLLFERGAFGAGDTAIVSRVQMAYALQIPFYVLGIIGVRLLSALGRNRWIMWISAGNLVVNVVANLVFMHFWGVVGIALSTSLVYIISCTAIALLVRRSLRPESREAQTAAQVGSPQQ
ncbi:murein biosynthesis integral membrane protein MurJ [soil metagenome]